MAADSDRPLAVARASGLIRPGEPLLVLLSGGADSVCLLDVGVRLGAPVGVLHVDHGLREDSGEDAELCRRLCESLGVPLAVERIGLDRDAPGNLQAEARRRRYELAERHAEGDYAAAHTATDQAETVLYRLATSPGRRALLGMRARRGRLVRPLLEATRADPRAYCEARGLEWRDDPSNEDLHFARARVRHEVLPALRELNPALERTIGETVQLLRDEAEVLDRAVREVGPPPFQLVELGTLPVALARLVLRAAAEEAAGRELPLSRRDADRVLALRTTGTAIAQLPGGVRAVAEYGVLRFELDTEVALPEPARLEVPGRVRFGPWDVEVRPAEGADLLDAGALGRELVVRGWRAGDRMRPAGLGGSKTLQDLFTDSKVPRVERASWPVVEAGGEIACVPAVAVAERFRAGDGPVVGISARRVT
ncbi:MAG: tRNA(Ile)-lysidine synthase [Thermoleophilaceae bacterium]|nr:tRNA(Ile)-lysidine synthase [Thermoleophilaceae bacterium]